MINKVINPPIFTILDSQDLNNFILANEFSQEICKNFKLLCQFIITSLSAKLVSSLESPVAFDEKCQDHFLFLILINDVVN